jgi:hypothetical protein
MRTVPALKLFDSAVWLQEQWPQSRNSVLDWSLDIADFCSCEIKNNESPVPRPKFFLSAGQLQKQRPQNRETLEIDAQWKWFT